MSWAITTEADLNRLVRIGATTESLHLDFKSALDRGPGAQAELGRDISQFANHLGGVLLLGVDERKDPLTNVKTAIQIRGVKDPDKEREDIEGWIRNVLAPADFTRTIDFIRTQGVVVVAVNVPPSRRLIWVNDPGQQNRLEVVRRTNHGKDYMRPGEIERQWSNTLRSAQIAFHEAYDEARSRTPLGSPVEGCLVGGVSRIAPALTGRVMQPMSRSPVIEQPDPRGFTLVVPLGAERHTLRVPFELLSTAWVDGNVMHVLCRAPIIFDAQAKLLRFDPFDQLKW